METNREQSRPAGALASSKLLRSAVAGLIGAGGAAGCKNSDSGSCEAPVAYNKEVANTIPSYDDPPAAFAAFKTLCDERGGYLQTHAWCSGNNSCKGVSWSFGVLTDHSCAAMNTCEGFSCVEPIADKGLMGQAIFTTSCKGCHGAVEGKFQLVVKPGTGAERVAAFQADTAENAERLVSTVAFGTQGHNQNGTAYANMPTFRAQLSKAEIKRVVDYVRSLPLAEPAEYVVW
jgi:cytochrome c551/c552